MPIVLKIIAWETSIWVCLSLPIFAFVSVLFTHSAIDLVSVDFKGLMGYSFGQLGRTNHSTTWDKIYQAEPYRYFGLRFLLVRYHGSDIHSCIHFGYFSYAAMPRDP